MKKWFCVKTAWKTEAKGRPQRVNELFRPDLASLEERCLLVRARTAQEAFRKVDREAKEYGSLSYQNIFGQTVEKRLLRRMEFYECEGEPGDLFEAYSQSHEVPRAASEKALEKIIFGRKETAGIPKGFWNLTEEGILRGLIERLARKKRKSHVSRKSKRSR